MSLPNDRPKLKRKCAIYIPNDDIDFDKDSKKPKIDKSEIKNEQEVPIHEEVDYNSDVSEKTDLSEKTEIQETEIPDLDTLERYETPYVEMDNEEFTCSQCGNVWDGNAQCFPCIDLPNLIIKEESDSEVPL